MKKSAVATNQLSTDLEVFLQNTPDLYVILSPDFRIVATSKAYLKASNFVLREIKEKKIFDIFPRDQNGDECGAMLYLRNSLLKAVETKQEDIIPVQRYDINAGTNDKNKLIKYWQLTNIPVLNKKNKIKYILHKVDDITERHLNNKQFLNTELRLLQTESIGQMGSYQANLLTGKVDFSDGLCNIIGWQPGTFKPSLKFMESISDPTDILPVRKIIQQAKKNKKPFHYYRRIYRPDGQLVYLFSKGQIICDENNKPIKLHGIVQDVTKQARTDLMLDTINEVCFELDHEFKIKYANKQACEFWNKNPKSVLNKDIWVVYPDGQGTRFSDILSTSLHDNKQMIEEVWNPAANKWVFLNVTPSQAGIIVMHFDISDHVRARQQLQHNQKKLKASQKLIQSIFDTSLIGMSLLKAVYDKNGIITDFTIMIANKELERQTNRTDLIGKLYAQEYPGIKQSGLFDLMLKVIETGKPEQVEYYYPHEGFNRWFSSVFVKIDHGIVASNLDITLRKEAEGEKYKNFTILQQAEDVAQMGSWNYNIDTGEFKWSEGMYRLFDISPNLDVTPEIYLKYATKQNKKVAARIIKAITSGTALFEEELEIMVNQITKCIKIRASVVPDKNLNSNSVIGVDMDITATKKTETDLKNVQDNLYKEIINAQEEERRRVAETLHNEFGQLLSIAKMKIPAENIESVDLLNKAILKVRSISYELMPPILNDFGLEFALKDMVEKKLNDTGIRYSFNMKGLKKRISPVMEVAIYRILQELLNNVIKHAKATYIKLTLQRNNDNIIVELSDDGVGIAKSMNQQSKNKNGFGLNYIANRVKVLEGQMSIVNNNDKGCAITLKLPLSDD